MNVYYLYLFVVLASVSFFNPLGVFDEQMGKLVIYLGILFSLVVSFSIKGNNMGHDFPKKAYNGLLLGISLSMVMASCFHVQTMETTLVATLYYLLPYMFLFILFKFKIPIERIEKTIWILCFWGMTVYIVNMISAPNIIFGGINSLYDESRGMLRLAINFLELIVMFFFYSINQWVLYKRKKDAVLASVCFLFIVLSLTRQYILFSSFLGLLFLFKNLSAIKRLSLIVIVFLIYLFVLPQIPIYNSLVETTKMQAESNKYESEDVRVQAYKFYMYEYQTNTLSHVLGNGVPSFTSVWGDKFKTITQARHVFAADVGWVGFYWYFGIIATFSLFVMFLKAALKKKDMDKEYLSYWFYYIIFACIASAPILYAYQILSVVTGLYLVYAKKNDSGINS